MNSPTDLSLELKRFLHGWITSYEQLQALLLLRQRRDDEFSSASAAEVLHISEAAAAEALEHLCRLSLAEVHVASSSRIFKYAPGSMYLSNLVDELAASWDRNQLTVMNLMSSNAIERVRTKAIRTFADAFIVGKKKSDG